MSSIADPYFPRLVWRESQKRLWNPILKKPYKIRPEERVRLRIVEFLLDSGWSKHRITTEESVPYPKNERGLRTDLICYSSHFEPLILVECKAERVPIKSSVAQQTARYNRYIEAPYILLSNGIRDLWFTRTDNEGYQQTDRIPEPLGEPPAETDRELDYWMERGFVGKKAGPSLRTWIAPVLNTFWDRSGNDRSWLDFRNSPTDISLEHYYRIRPVPETDEETPVKVAVGFTDTPYGGTRLIGIINQSQANIGMVEISLDRAVGDDAPNGTVYAETGASNFDARDYIRIREHSAPGALSRDLPTLLYRCFRDHHEG